MKTVLAMSVAFASVTLSSPTSANTLTPIHDVDAAPQSYDRQTITIAGTVTSKLEMRPTGADARPYDVLVICDGRSCVLARLQGELGDVDFPDVRDAYVNVRGTFSAAAHVGSQLVPQQLVVDMITFTQLSPVRKAAGG